MEEVVVMGGGMVCLIGFMLGDEIVFVVWFVCILGGYI